VLLLNFEHLAVASPYRSRHAIYVRENAAAPRLAVNEIPESLTIRLLSLRAYDRAGMMLNADVLSGPDLAAGIDRMLARASGRYPHVHNAKPGCFAAPVDRASQPPVRYDRYRPARPATAPVHSAARVARQRGS
jgi:hypothetical protein